MYIALKKEVTTYSKMGYIIIKNINSGSFRILSKQAAVLVYLLKGIRSYDDLKKDFFYLTGDENIRFELIIKDLKPYLHFGEKLHAAGINELNMDSIVSFQSIKDISTLEYPINIFLRTTNLCDKNCAYCSESQRMNAMKKSYFPTELVKNIFLNFDNRNIFFEITGGEPLLHPQLMDIIINVNKLNIPIAIITKATGDYLFFRNVLKTNTITRVCFSLDSHRQQYVDRITRKKGTFHNIVECMKIARECHVAIDINAVITTYNMNDLEGLIAFCIENGVSNLHLTTMWPVSGTDVNLIIDENTQKIMYSTVSQMRETYKSHINIELTTSKCEGKNRCEKCGKALTDVKIECNGEISLCNGMVIGNLSDACLYDIWNSSKARKIRNELIKQMAT